MVLLNNHGHETPAHWQPWDGSDISAEHRILGMGTVEMTVRYLQRTVSLLKELFNYTVVTESEKKQYCNPFLVKCLEKSSFKN